MPSMNALLDPELGSGWNVIDAVGINEFGQIVGSARSDTLGFRAVLLSPVPEPATALLMVLGSIGLSAMRRRLPGR